MAWHRVWTRVDDGRPRVKPETEEEEEEEEEEEVRVSLALRSSCSSSHTVVHGLWWVWPRLWRLPGSLDLLTENLALSLHLISMSEWVSEWVSEAGRQAASDFLRPLSWSMVSLTNYLVHSLLLLLSPSSFVGGVSSLLESELVFVTRSDECISLGFFSCSCGGLEGNPGFYSGRVSPPARSCPVPSRPMRLFCTSLCVWSDL